MALTLPGHYGYFVGSKGFLKLGITDFMVYDVEDCPGYYSMPTNISGLYFPSSQSGQPKPPLDTTDARY